MGFLFRWTVSSVVLQMCCQAEPGVVAMDWNTGCVEMDRKGLRKLEGGLGWLVSALVITVYIWITQGLCFLSFFFFLKGF